MTDYTNPNDPWMQTGYDPFKGMSEDERMKAGCMQAVVFVLMIALGLGNARLCISGYWPSGEFRLLL